MIQDSSRKTARLCFLLATMLLLVVSASRRTEAEPSTAEFLKGTEGFPGVVVNLMGSENIIKRVSRERLQAVIELALRREGLLVPGKGSAALLATVALVDITGSNGAAFSISLLVNKWVRTERGPLLAAGWELHYLGVGPVDKLSESIERQLLQLLEEVMNRYYEANPKIR